MENSKNLPASKGLEHQLKATLIDVFTQKKLANPKLGRPKLLLAFSGGINPRFTLTTNLGLTKYLPRYGSAAPTTVTRALHQERLMKYKPHSTAA